MSLLEIKQYLHIEHNYDDSILQGMIDSSIKYFKNHYKISKNFDETGDLERELLKERVRYAYNKALDEFELNFTSEILTLQIIYAEKDEATSL